MHLIGVNDSTGLYQFSNAKGGPTYRPNLSTDKTVLINTAPTFYGGFLNTFNYRGVSLDVLFQFVKQVGENLFGSYEVMPGMMANQPVDVLNRWEKLGDMKPYQKFSQAYSAAYNSFNDAQFYSDRGYSDASFIRLKNVALSWQLPEKWKKGMHFQNCRIYFQGQNLLTITNYKGIDPETKGTVLPPLKVYTVGVECGF